MTLLFYITLTITGALVLAAALIVAWLVGRHVNRVRRRNKKAQDLDNLMMWDERDTYLNPASRPVRRGETVDH